MATHKMHDGKKNTEKVIHAPIPEEYKIRKNKTGQFKSEENTGY